ncbi:hypothetical protein ACRAWD_08445 [Caulobacter segnis]
MPFFPRNRPGIAASPGPAGVGWHFFEDIRPWLHLRPPERHDRRGRKAARELARDFGEVTELQISRGRGGASSRGMTSRLEEQGPVRDPDQGASGLFVPGRGTRRMIGLRQDPPGSSTRWTAPPASCTPSRTSPRSISPCSAGKGRR